MSGKDETKVSRVTNAMLRMQKLEIDKLKDANEQG